jgi:hypothetical protein
LVERKSHRGDISAVKPKRTDTTLDPARLLAIDQTYIIGCWEKGGLTKPKGKGAGEKRKQDSTEEEERIYTCGRRQGLASSVTTSAGGDGGGDLFGRAVLEGVVTEGGAPGGRNTGGGGVHRDKSAGT